MKRDIIVQRFYPYPPERVWRAITESQLLSKWLMENDFEAKLQHRFTFRMKPQRGWDGITHCEVIELEPFRKVAFTYRGQATGEKTIACAGIDSRVADAAVRGIFTKLDTVLRITLTPEGKGTKFVLEHTGFNGFKLAVVSLVMEYGWRKSVLPRLSRVLDEME